MQRWLAVAIQTAALAVLACGDNSQRPRDGGMESDVGAIDDGALGDGGSRLTWVELTLTGCATTTTPGSGDAGPVDGGVSELCTGTAPLTLGFTALGSAPVDNYDWDFGDGSRSQEGSPVHIYELPGVYSVRLTGGGPGGTAEIVKVNIISVVQAELGARCTIDAQCLSQKCVCGNGAPCPPGLERGMCSAPCSAITPCAEGVCSDLAAGSPLPPADWQQSLCLPACPAGSGCRDGLSCQELPTGDTPGWTRACFAPGVVRAMGEPCFDAFGNPVHALCAGGFCASMGARGMCSASCISGDCPPSSACASFAGVAPDRCLRRCDAPGLCAADPWLACEQPGGSGSLDFLVDEPAFGGGYCAPRSCTLASECGPDGACTGGFCLQDAPAFLPSGASGRAR